MRSAAWQAGTKCPRSYSGSSVQTCSWPPSSTLLLTWPASKKICFLSGYACGTRLARSEQQGWRKSKPPYYCVLYLAFGQQQVALGWRQRYSCSQACCQRQNAELLRSCLHSWIRESHGVWFGTGESRRSSTTARRSSRQSPGRKEMERKISDDFCTQLFGDIWGMDLLVTGSLPRESRPTYRRG